MNISCLWEVFETSITYKRRLKDVFKTSFILKYAFPVNISCLWDVFETSNTYKRRLKDVFKTSCILKYAFPMNISCLWDVFETFEFYKTQFLLLVLFYLKRTEKSFIYQLIKIIRYRKLHESDWFLAMCTVLTNSVRFRCFFFLSYDLL